MQARAAATVALLLSAALLAGCSKPAPGPAPQPAVPFDGQAALDAVEAFALQADGTPRFRIPGTAGQAEGIQHLWAAMDVPDWERSRSDFNGTDYLALDRGAVASYGPGSPDCPDEWEEKLPGLPFTNLWAVMRGAGSGPSEGLVILAAHWDSQPESNFDPDPAKRHLPDPGANDGASGVGVLLELMRHLSENHVHLPFDVAVLLLDGEDGFFSCYPLAGSLHFAQDPPEEVRAFILLDMVCDPGARFPLESTSRGSAPELQDLLWEHGERLAPENFVDDHRSVLDDHTAFIQEGVPSVDIIDLARADSPNGGFPPQWDTTHDTVDKLSAGLLGKVGQALLDALQDPRFEGTLR